MLDSKYPDFENHCLSHKKFIEKINIFKNDYANNSLNLPDLISYLINWLTNHILHEDKKYKDSFIRAGIDKKIF